MWRDFDCDKVETESEEGQEEHKPGKRMRIQTVKIPNRDLETGMRLDLDPDPRESRGGEEETERRGEERTDPDPEPDPEPDPDPDPRMDPDLDPKLMPDLDQNPDPEPAMDPRMGSRRLEHDGSVDRDTASPLETGARTPVSVKVRRIEERSRTHSDVGGGSKFKQPTLSSVWRRRSGLQGSPGLAVDIGTSESDNTAGVRAGRDPQTKPDTGARGRKGKRRGGRILRNTVSSGPMDRFLTRRASHPDVSESAVSTGVREGQRGEGVDGAAGYGAHTDRIGEQEEEEEYK